MIRLLTLLASAALARSLVYPLALRALLHPRAMLASAAPEPECAAADAAGGTLPPVLGVAAGGASGRDLTRQGMDLFRAGDVAGSIARFDDARDAQPSLDPYLWQRGLSLYYAKRYADGAAQFRRDVAVNPNDTEESIWAFLCEAQMPGLGFDAAQRNFLKVGRDSRAVMRAAYELFAGRATQADLATAGAEGGVAGQFYADLYLGLYNEAKGDVTLAREYVRAAAKSSYGESRDYMHALAVVHKEQRGW